MFFGELDDLELCPGNRVAELQKLRRLLQIGRVDRECVPDQEAKISRNGSREKDFIFSFVR